MSSRVESVDVVVGLCWGDEGKGKITSQLANSGKYNLVARWAGGNNAGHTVYMNGQNYKTHLIPSGIFYNIPSLIGPGCVLHPPAFLGELNYLQEHGFNIDLIKVHPNCHIVQEKHLEEDRKNLAEKFGTTSKGIAPAYAAKAARTGILAKDVLEQKYLWEGPLEGNILCEGAQGVWLDMDHGDYPYVTSSITLPYGACSLGFAPQKINQIFGCAKIYDTRSGQDPRFPDSLLEIPEFQRLGELGKEFGVTTGRRRKIRWLSLDKLIDSINLTGTTDVIINKCDILKELGIFRLAKSGVLQEFKSLEEMQEFIEFYIGDECPMVEKIQFSYSPEKI